MGVSNVDNDLKSDEIRWQVMKAMLKEFPMLKEKVKCYLKEVSESD